jgi:integrase
MEMPLATLDPSRPAFTPPPSLSKVLKEFANFCRSENALHHAQSKEGILKAAFGVDCLSIPPRLDGPLAVSSLGELSCSAVEAFVTAGRNRKAQPLARKTKHHYREVFVQLFNFALKRSYYLPTNIAFPNPMSGLPAWNDQSGTILFLRPEDVTAQLKALQGAPVLHACVATLIYAGPRRAEALWLRRESLRVSEQGARYLSIRAIRDEATDKKGTLKTRGSARSVPLCPELAAILDPYLLTHKSDWLFPAPKGGRWDKDHFSQALAKANAAAGLPWTAGHYRHTYATLLASSGYSVFALARQMGTSIAMIMRHYAAFFAPEATR